MDEIDKLLANIDKKQPIDRTIDPATPNIVPPAVKQQQMNSKSIDDLLGSLGASSPQSPSNQPTRSNAAQPDKSIDSLISSVKEDLEADRLAKEESELRRQQELELERQKQERDKQARLDRLAAQRREELKKEAQIWLRQLKPKSDEARWFEEFACNYDTTLEAAIEYLDALKTVDNTILKQ